MNNSIDCLCIGHASYDIILTLSAFPEENNKVQIDESYESGGGPAANAAYALGMWGKRVAFAGRIGNDRYGDAILREFASQGVRFLKDRNDQCHTAVSTILVNQGNGSRTIINRKTKGPPLQLTAQDISGFDPYLLLFDGHELPASQLTLQAFPNAISVLDAGSLREGTLLLAKEVDYLVASESFARDYCRIDEINSEENLHKCIQTLEELSGPPVIVTLGERGLIYSEGGSFRKMEAMQVNALDTTGAGDLFHAAFAWGLMKKMPLRGLLRFASIAAALSVSKPGGRQSFPDLSNILEQSNLAKRYGSRFHLT